MIPKLFGYLFDQFSAALPCEDAMTPIPSVAKCTKIGLPALALALLPSPAQAHFRLPIGSGLASAISTVLLSSGSHCIGYTYDKNGNRVLVSSAAVGLSSVNWGAGTYGCFVWGQ